MTAVGFQNPNTQYRTHLNTELVWYSNGRFVSGCQMVRYLNGDLKTLLKKAYLCHGTEQ